MSLNNSKNFVVGNHVKGPIKTLDSVRRYLKFDSSGNVADLLTDPQSPAYVTTAADPGLTLKFPSTFPSGKTPDEELDDGVTLTAQGFATNSAGSSGPLSDTVQPSSTVRASSEIESLTGEQLNAQKAKFLTYENRAAVKQGEQAVARREELSDQLKQAGLELPEF